MYIYRFESFILEMLIISILILLLAVTTSNKPNYNYLADYVKFNRIVFIIFILGGYLAYNTLNVDAFGGGIGIYGGVFKITVLSQVFDIILFITGALVTILTCFVPYNFKIDEGYKLEEYPSAALSPLKRFLNKIALKKKYYMESLSNSNKSDSNISNETLLDRISTLLNVYENKVNFVYLIDNKFNYSRLEVKEYTFLLLYTVLGGSLLISSQNLISLYLSLELQSFTLYILSASQIRSFRGTSGGLKYFLLGGLSSGFILLGCSLLYAYTGTLNMEHIFMMYSDSATNYFIDPCLLVLFAGLLFKVSAAPFHNWAPDVYSDVPTYSTTWLIIIAKLSILILMLLLIHNVHSGLNLNNLDMLEQCYSLNSNNIDNVVYNSNSEGGTKNIDLKSLKSISSLYINDNIPFSFWNPSYSSLGLWTNVLTLSALFSLIIGTVVGLSQSRIKRLFAYSTITHVGFLLLALSLNTIASIDAFIFYLIQYTITNLNLFFILVAWGYLYSRYYLEKDFIPVKGLKINPLSLKYGFEETTYDYDEYINRDDWNDGKDLKVNTVYNYLAIHDDINFSDFDTEDTEWLYTPVPFLTNLKGMHSSDPFLAFCLAVTIFSLAGIPPLIGFFAKQQVLLASMQMDYYFISIVAIFTSVIGAAYYLRIIKFIYFYDDVFMPYYISDSYYNKSIDNEFTPKSKFTLSTIDGYNYIPMLASNNLSLVIALLTNISLFYILKPYILINTIYMITIPLFQI